MVSTSDSDGLRKLIEASELEYTFLHDDGGEVIERYGLRNLQHPPDAGVLPHPASLVIDREGRIRYKRVDVDYSVRPPAEELVEAVRSLPRTD